jgi:hypothetical protein
MSNSDKTGSGRGRFADDSDRWRAQVKLLVQRFPHLDVGSLQGLERHLTFRELCEEYEACLDALGRLSASGPDEGIHQEYVALQLRLEGELLRYLSESVNGSRR